MKTTLFFGMVVALIFGFSFWFTAWSQSNDIMEYLHAGIEGQIKQGGLLLADNSGVKFGLIVEHGKVGIGTLNPLAMLDVAGVIRAVDFSCSGCLEAKDLASTGVDAGTYGDEENIPQITIDEDGRVTSASTVSALQGSATSSPGSVMYLRRGAGLEGQNSPDPSTCPAEWKEASFAIENVSDSRKNKVRTCYTVEQSCQVMYLRSWIGSGISSASNPEECPEQWSEADLGLENVDSTDVRNYVRTCYICI
jgi:hypothetical protein